MNLTLHNLISSSLSGSSPFLSFGQYHTSNSFKFSSISLSHSLNSFFYSNSFKTCFSLHHSTFTKFLSSVISIHSDEYNSQVFKNKQDDPLSFVSTLDTIIDINECMFLSNVNNMFAGGALLISGKSYTITISKCNFTDNHANFGGAVMIVSLFGNLFISNSYFSKNSATQGSHICATLNMSSIIDTIFTNSTGQNSVFLSFSEMSPKSPMIFQRSLFYSNEGFVHVDDGKFDQCCLFMVANSSDKFFTDSSKITLSSTCINLLLLEDGTTQNPTAIWTKSGNEECYWCQLVPSPSQTVAAKWNLNETILSLVAFGVIFIISVLGIVCVVSGLITKCCGLSQPQNTLIVDDQLISDKGDEGESEYEYEDDDEVEIEEKDLSN